MSYLLPPEPDDDSDRERRARAEAAERRRLVDALCNVPMKGGGSDRVFIVGLRSTNLARLTKAEQERLDRLAWKHRRELSDDLRPKLPPFDPIVREMKNAGV